MLIIIEGPDGAGKTTLAKRLAKGVDNSEIVHFGMPANAEEEDNYYKVYMEAIDAAARQPEKLTIFDRCWFSDAVYGPVMRDRVRNTHIMQLLSAYAASHGAMVIYCTGTPTKLWKRCQERGEDYIKNVNDFYSICDVYDAVMDSEVHLVVTRYRTT